MSQPHNPGSALAQCTWRRASCSGSGSHIQLGVDLESKGSSFGPQPCCCQLQEELIIEKNNYLHPKPARCACLRAAPRLPWDVAEGSVSESMCMRQRNKSQTSIFQRPESTQKPCAGLWSQRLAGQCDGRAAPCYSHLFPHLGLHCHFPASVCVMGLK